MILSHAFRSPAELAAACQQWIEVGSCSEAARYAVLAYRMAREQHPRTFPRPEIETHPALMPVLDSFRAVFGA